MAVKTENHSKKSDSSTPLTTGSSTPLTTGKKFELLAGVCINGVGYPPGEYRVGDKRLTGNGVLQIITEDMMNSLMTRDRISFEDRKRAEVKTVTRIDNVDGKVVRTVDQFKKGY